MLNHIYGKIVFVNKSYLILEAYGIGYKLNMYDTSGINVGEYKRLYIHYLIKNDNKNYINGEMYAFTSPIERNLFIQLITINGIGPIIASKIIEAGYKNVIKFIINEDLESLTKIKGINEKIARQIIANLLTQYQKIAESLEIEKYSAQDNEFIEALKQLGYNQQEINFALKSIDQNLDLDEKIGKSIKIIALNHGQS